MALRKLLNLRLLLLLATASLADVSSAKDILVPTNFTNAPDSLQNLIEFPGVVGDVEIVIPCESYVAVTGKLGATYCRPIKGVDFVFENSIYKAVLSSRLTPATRNGKPIRVLFQFSVVFSKRGAVEDIRVYGYQFRSFDRLGTRFLAPQWYALRRSSGSLGPCNWPSGVLASAIIGVDGSPATVESLSGSDRCRRFLEKYLSLSKFIPATFDGVSIEAEFMRFYYPHSLRATKGFQRRNHSIRESFDRTEPAAAENG